MDDREIHRLIRDGDSEDWRVRSDAIKTLSEIGEPAIPALITALKDKSWLVRSFAVEALGKIGGSKAVPALIDALNDEDEDVRNMAAWELCSISRHAADKGDYASALKTIKDLTTAMMEFYSGKKDMKRIRRQELSKLEYLTQEIHDKINPEKKKFPVKHQPVRRIQGRKVRTNG